MPANGGKRKKNPSLVGSAPMVWKIRPIWDDCKEKAILTPKKPKVMAKIVFNEIFGSALWLVAAGVASVDSMGVVCAIGVPPFEFK
ncbi:hypothetical protein HMPREF0495_00534 [Levilactobacillus brevis ATCC 14869 = DSM 20054]|uniref:Uncharacterized protein n=1 Tax=Levilactobacillus brevis ATCC 14869 = DSM 20054 TaxID=649758 RepID=U2R2G1_LEVBR|nr:hypothetical protein HMPREF0495_00534 [Levilactobacillus brevis ATCC 14869 = DSM 20054]